MLPGPAASRMSPRPLFAAVAVACLGLLGYGYYLEYFEHLDPCPLCIIQRLLFMAAGAIALIAALHGPRAFGNRVYAVLLALAAGGGAATAARQVWLQHLPPDRVPECGAGLELMVEMYGWGEALARVLRGTGDCAEVDWTFLGMSIAEWSLAWFLVFALAALAVLVRPQRPDAWKFTE